MKTRSLIAGSTLLFTSAGFLHAGWQAGLLGGAIPSTATFNTTAFPAITNSYLGPHVATSAVSSTSTTTEPWKSNQTWAYFGEIHLEAGTTWFAENIDDAVYLRIWNGDTPVLILNNTVWNGISAGAFTAPDSGWYRIDLRLWNGSGGAGPVSASGWTAKGFGYKIGGASSTDGADYTYPEDDGSMSLFRYDDGLGFDDVLEITGAPAEYGVVSPPYGMTNGLVAGDSFLCSAPTGTVTVATGTRAGCTGYQLYTNESVLAAGGTTNAFAYTHDLRALLVWQWERAHEMIFAAGPGGSVSHPGGWYTEGSNVTVTATPADGHAFVYWDGDIPAAFRYNPSFAWVADQPRAITACFRSVADGADKYWVGVTAGGDGVHWEDGANWDPAGEPTLDDRVFITNGAPLAASSARARTLAIGARGSLWIACTGNVYKAIALTNSATSLMVLGDVGLAGMLALGGRDNAGGTALRVAGDLSLSNSAVLAVYAGQGGGSAPADFQAGGSQMEIGGTLKLTNTAVLFPVVNGASGLPVVLTASNVTVAAGAAIDATFYDPANTWQRRSYGWGYATAPGYCATLGGGSHGGRGGGNVAESYCYGYAQAPFYPGSPGHNQNGIYGQGGGAIRIDCGAFALGGMLRVRGGNYNGMSNGGGSGGSVWITCASFDAATSASIDASGGDSTQHGGSYGGGGGRVAIFDGTPSAGQIDQLYQTGTCADFALVTTNFNDVETSPIPAVTDITGGLNTENTINPGYVNHGKPGTMAWLRNRAGLVVLTVGGTRFSTETTPRYGVDVHGAGDLDLASPSHIYEYGSGNLARFPCTGYTWTNVVGGYGTGTTTAVTLDLQSDTTFTWTFGTRQYYMDVRSGGFGAVSWDETAWRDEGTTFSLTAVPDAGCEFLYWVGDIPHENRTDASITINSDQPRIAIACFASATPRALSWTGGTENNLWFHPANWGGSAIPGPLDTVTVAAGTFDICYPCDLALASLAISGTAAGYIGSENAMVSWNHVGATTTPFSYPLRDDERPYALAVARNLVLSGTSRLVLEGFSNAARFDLTVGGSLALSNGAALYIYAGAQGPVDDVATYQEGGASVTVGGALILAGTSTLYPACHVVSGAPVVIAADRVDIGPTASINADYRGFGHTWVFTGTAYSYTFHGPGIYPTSSRIGGSHGGPGTGNTITNCGHLLAPYLPGSSGIAYYTTHRLGGGGAVRIDARRIDVNGKITAIGYGGYCWGGGAGGGIWLTADAVALGSAALLSVRGGNSASYGATGGGGGGRIAIGLKFGAGQIDRLYADGAARGATVVDLTTDAAYSNKVNVAGGNGYWPGYTFGGSGTAVLAVAPPPGSLMILR